jgi:hypothetical protein
VREKDPFVDEDRPEGHPADFFVVDEGADLDESTRLRSTWASVFA